MGFKGFFKKKDGGSDPSPKGDGAGASSSAGGNGSKPAPANGSGGAEGENKGGFKPDPVQAKKWFERAKAVADSGQYDYAIECFAHGLRADPDNMNQHEALREVAKRRRVNGGKPVSPFEKMKSGGKTPLDRMLHAEIIWAKEPFSVPLMIAVMERAVEADQAESELNLAEVANWVGNMVLDGGQRDKPLSKKDLLKVRDLFRAIQVYDRALEACRLALNLDRTDTDLLMSMRDLETEGTMKTANFDDIKSKESTFRTFVRDQDKQDELAAKDQLVKTDSTMDRLIASRRAEAQADPEDAVKQAKLADALQEKESDDSQGEAARIYRQLFDKTNQYLYKEQAGNIQIKMLSRQSHDLKKILDVKPGEPKAIQNYQSHLRKFREFELEEWTDRVKNYPTEAQPKFRMGELLYAFKKYDEAIAAFQQAKSAPVHRAPSLAYLGKCYMVKGWFDEAIAAFTEGIDNYPNSGDKVGMDLRYNKMLALAQAAEKNKDEDMARDAMKVGSQILQNNINYKDIKAQMDKIRKLVTDLKDASRPKE